MIDKETCSEIFRKYHNSVFGFCFGRLRNPAAAEDCTQEVFLTLLKKKESIVLSDRLPSWLMAAADRICRKYRGKLGDVPLDIDDYSDSIPDPAAGGVPLSEELFALLGSEDAGLLVDYLGAGHGERRRIAEKLGISPNALCQRIKRIRNRVIRYLDENGR